MATQIKQNASGLFELLVDGKRVSTGTKKSIERQALRFPSAPTKAPVIPAPTPSPTVGVATQPSPTRTAPPIPESLYQTLRGSVASGGLSAENAKSTINAYLQGGLYSGSVDVKKLFPAGLSVTTPGGETKQFDSSFTGRTITTGRPVETSIISGGLNTPDTTSPVITPGSGRSTARFNLPRGTSDSLGADTLVAGATSNLEQIKQSQAEEAALRSEASGLTGEIDKLFEGSLGVGAEQLSAEQQANIPGLTSQVANVNSQIQTKLAEFNALTADVQGKPITMNSIIGAQAQIRNVAASEIGLLQAQAQGLQGQLSAAQQTVDRAIDLKYKDKEQEIQLKQAQLASIQSELTAAENKTATLLNSQYKQEQAQLDATKAFEKAQTNAVLSSMQKYPDADISVNDTLETANFKIQNNSAKYKKEVRQTGGTTSTGESGIPITPEDKRGLLGAGFSTNDITNIENDVNQFGVDAVLENITDQTQKKAIEKTYGVQAKVTKQQIETQVTQKVAQDSLKSTFTQEELEQLAIDNGYASFFKSKDTEVKNFLNSPKAKEVYVNSLIEQYKTAGIFEE